MIDLNNFYCEDCKITMNKMKNNLVDLILTSPPYNMTKRKGGYADKEKRYDLYNDWRSEKDYNEGNVDIFKKFDEILNKNGVVLYNFSYSIENPS